MPTSYFAALRISIICSFVAIIGFTTLAPSLIAVSAMASNCSSFTFAALRVVGSPTASNCWMNEAQNSIAF